MSDLVGNPEDRFSHVAAQMSCLQLYHTIINLSYNQLETMPKRITIQLAVLYFQIENIGPNLSLLLNRPSLFS